MKNKKAQLTVFIIIGIVILFSVAAVFYAKQRISAAKSEAVPALEEVPVELQPLQNFITECVEQSAEKGLELVGSQGGYIDTSAFKINQQNPTESDALYLDSSTIVPYWHYLKSENDCSLNCKFNSNMPPLERKNGFNSIEEQLENYISIHVKRCVNNFESFKQQGYSVKEIKKPSADVVFANYDTKVVVTYPIEVNKEGVNRKMNKFYVKIPLEFKKIYLLSKKIKEMEEDTSDLDVKGRFLEKQALALIAGFSDLNSGRLPPWRAFSSILGSREYWVKTNVRQEVEDILDYYTKFLQIKDTRYTPINAADLFGRDFYEKSFRQMDFELESVENKYDYKNTFVSFDFRKDPKVVKNIYFDIDCDGEICKPETINAPMLSWIGMGIQNYQFNYDVSYPVLVEINDLGAFNNQGYRFVFALEGNIRKNEIMKGDYVEISSLDLSSEISPCDIDQRNSGEINIVIKDAETNAEIKDASTTFGVGNVACEAVEI